MPDPSSLFTELTVSTLKNRRRDIVDNMSAHNALYRRMKERNNMQTLDGGTTIVENLEFAENQTFQRYSGYDTLNINPSTVFTAAEFEWRQASESVTYSGREMRINMGSKTRVFDLVRARVDNAIKSAANCMNRDMYSSGAQSNQMGGLQLLVADTPTNTVGGINAGTYSWWANQTFDLAENADGAAVKLAIDKAYIALTRGTDKPDFVLMDPDMYALFEGSLQALQRYTSAREAEAGFETLRYKGADVFFDQVTDDLGNSVMPAGHIYLINTSYLKLRQHRDAEWTVAEDKFPINQDSVVIPLLWMGNMTISNRKRQGVIVQAGGGGSDTDTTTSSSTTTTTTTTTDTTTSSDTTTTSE